MARYILDSNDDYGTYKKSLDFRIRYYRLEERIIKDFSKWWTYRW